ncbi:hypothetical protein PybrP1_005136 [[Pythium] brassicae (nom. inval.)]|nr:hypothetical protein PybrP1_005136 [[Pythium] brassicae (nom. inval.)]
MSTLVADDVDEQLMGTFASFLVQDPTIGFLAPTTYLSSVKRQLEELTRTDFFCTRKNWYASLCGVLRKRYIKQSVQQSRPLQEQAPLMTVEDLVVLTETLFVPERHPSSQGQNAVSLSVDARRTHLGRWRPRLPSPTVGGRVPTARVSRKTTRQEHTVAVFPTALKWQCDPLHALAAQAAVGSYGLSTSLFSLHQSPLGLARPRERGRGSDKQFALALKPPWAAAVAASSADVNLSDMAHRGRWSMEGLDTLVEYISATSSSDQKVARELGGWHNPARKVAPARLDKDTREAANQSVFAERLFLHYGAQMPLRSLRHALAASLLLYLPDTLSASPEHLLHSSLRAALISGDSDVSTEEATDILLGWARSVWKRFVRENLDSLPLAQTSVGDDGTAKLNDTLEATVSRFFQAQREVAADAAALACRVEAVADKNTAAHIGAQRPGGGSVGARGNVSRSTKDIARSPYRNTVRHTVSSGDWNKMYDCDGAHLSGIVRSWRDELLQSGREFIHTVFVLVVFCSSGRACRTPRRGHRTCAPLSPSLASADACVLLVEVVGAADRRAEQGEVAIQRALVGAVEYCSTNTARQLNVSRTFVLGFGVERACLRVCIL